jgi:hypothetical protein
MSEEHGNIEETMKIGCRIIGKFKGQRGVSVILVALLMVIFMGLAALAIDLGHLYLVRNELQNAADAGALAGARFLYNSNGTEVNPDANEIARDAAIANRSEKIAVEVNWEGGNSGDVQRGHWSFATKTFSENDSLLPVDLWNTTFEELDLNPDFINAVQVTTWRKDFPVAAFFARIFGFDKFTLSAKAVAYIGFAGTLTPRDVDQPIAICADSILQNGQYTCTVGRMINSGQQVASSETGGWTDFYQGSDACQGGTNAQTVRSLVCGSGNPDPIYLGKNIATNGGDIASAFKDLRDCWVSKTSQTVPWALTLPVISCDGNNVGTCEKVLGAVTVNIVWITGEGEDSHYTNVPHQMGDWSSADSDGQVRWQSFVGHFNLKNADGTPAPYQKKAIYFLPDCTPHELTGVSGGVNFGILAKIPVLVK